MGIGPLLSNQHGSVDPDQIQSTIMTTRFRTILILSLLVILTAASISRADQYVELTVEKGDCLSKICEHWLQYPKDWPKIAELNNIKNSDLIHPGDKLVVPVDMLRGIPLNGTVTFVQGDVRISKGKDQPQTAVHLNDVILEGSRIVTGDDGSVRVTFLDGYTFVLRSNTNVRIIQANNKRASRLFFQLWMELGRIFSRIKKATGADARFEVDTPSAVAAVRGTEFRASVDAREDTRCEVLRGSLSLQANETEIEVKQGEGSLVRKGEPPSAPSKLLPPPSVTIPSPLFTILPAEIELGKVERAFRYRVMIATDPDFNAMFRETVIEPSGKFPLEHMPDGAYFLRVRSIDRAGIEGINSEPVQFRIRVHPETPALVSPQGDSVFRSGMLHFSWNSVPEAKGYRVQVSKDGLLHVLDEVVTGKTQRTFQLEPAVPSVYQVRIRSVAEDDYESMWSPVSSFRVVPPPPAPAVENVGKKGNRVRLATPTVEGRFRHEFQISKDPQFQEVVFSKTTEASEIIVEKPEDPGNYYVRTSLRLSEFESDFSPSTEFEVKEDSTLLSAILYVAFALAMILPVSIVFL